MSEGPSERDRIILDIRINANDTFGAVLSREVYFSGTHRSITAIEKHPNQIGSFLIIVHILHS